MSDFVTNALTDAASTLEKFSSEKTNISKINAAIDAMVYSFQNGASVLSCGNGGSMCDAIHFAEELSGRYRKDRKPLPATAISDPAYLTCVANDYGYEHVFSRYTDAWLQKNGCLLAISTSGNSKNVIAATKMAKEKDATTIGLLGKDGGQMRDLVNISIVVPSAITDRIQEVHIKIIHMMIEGIERKIFPENYK